MAEVGHLHQVCRGVEVRGGDEARPHQLLQEGGVSGGREMARCHLQRGVEHLGDGLGGRQAHVLLDVRPAGVWEGAGEGGYSPVHEGQVDAAGQVGGGQDEDVGEPLDGVYLGLWRTVTVRIGLTEATNQQGVHRRQGV